MTPQPESPEPLKVVAYLTTNEEGSPAMLFFDQQEAGNYCDLDEQPARLSLTDDAEAAIQAARNEAEAMRAAIDAHNAECESMCKSRQQLGKHHCPYAAYGRQCPDCPRDNMLDAAMKGDAHA